MLLGSYFSDNCKSSSVYSKKPPCAFFWGVGWGSNSVLKRSHPPHTLSFPSFKEPQRTAWHLRSIYTNLSSCKSCCILNVPSSVEARHLSCLLLLGCAGTGADPWSFIWHWDALITTVTAPYKILPCVIWQPPFFVLFFFFFFSLLIIYASNNNYPFYPKDILPYSLDHSEIWW